MTANPTRVRVADAPYRSWTLPRPLRPAARAFAEALFSTHDGPPPAERLDWLMEELDEILGDDVPQAAPAVFHYVGDQVEAEVYLPFDWCVDSARLDNLQERVRRRVEASPCWGRIALLCRIAP